MNKEPYRIRLLPCPFCGSKQATAVLAHDHPECRLWAAQCSSCSARGGNVIDQPPWADGEELLKEVEKKWNKREQMTEHLLTEEKA